MPSIIFEETFLVSGIYCSEYCGNKAYEKLMEVIPDVPVKTSTVIATEPETLGVHRFTVLVGTEGDYRLDANQQLTISRQFKTTLQEAEFTVTDPNTETQDSNKPNWLNLAVNLFTLITIVCLCLFFPPSLPLTIGLTTLSFLATTFTARTYLRQFWDNLRARHIAHMATPISMGWFLSSAHTVYHSILMPLASSFSMLFMSYMMPVLLIAIINGMDVIKKIILRKSQKMYSNGTNFLLPEMSATYDYYPLSQEYEAQISSCLLEEKISDEQLFNTFSAIPLKKDELQSINKNLLKPGMLIKIKPGECFPVDGLIIHGNTVVESSASNGELNRAKYPADRVPAGAVNLGQDVIIYTRSDRYNSTLNQLLFNANGKRPEHPKKSHKHFTILYTILVVSALIAAFVVPLALGILTVPLLLQNCIGILFTVCPCTIAIAHQLPVLIGIYQQGLKGIIIRNEQSESQGGAIHTVIFDKTGTLTTGNSRVKSYMNISKSLWQEIYLLEKHCGRDHPIARAIINCYESDKTGTISDQKEHADDKLPSARYDDKHRGLSGGAGEDEPLHIGNFEYIKECMNQPDFELPPAQLRALKKQLEAGYTPTYIARGMKLEGIILTQHEIRKGILDSMKRLKAAGVKLMMLTGDIESSAEAFNRQNNYIFEPKSIYADLKPMEKAAILRKIMSETPGPEDVLYIGDGLNDGPIAAEMAILKGTSCSISAQNKAAYFTHVSLDGTLDYLFWRDEANTCLKKVTRQNQGIISLSTLTYLIFIITFSLAGIPVLPLIPLGIMVSTTLFALFNSFRVKLAIDVIVDKNSSKTKQFLASDFSLGLLMVGSLLLVSALLISTLATGGLALPALVFAGTLTAISSSCTLGSIIMFGLFVIAASAYLINAQYTRAPAERLLPLPKEASVNSSSDLILREPKNYKSRETRFFASEDNEESLNLFQNAEPGM